MNKTFLVSASVRVVTLFRYLTWALGIFVLFLLVYWAFISIFNFSFFELPVLISFSSVYAVFFLIILILLIRRLWYLSSLSLEVNDDNMVFNSIYGTEKIKISMLHRVYVILDSKGDIISAKIPGKYDRYALELFNENLALIYHLKKNVDESLIYVEELDLFSSNKSILLLTLFVAGFLSLVLSDALGFSTGISYSLYLICFFSCFLLVVRPITQHIGKDLAKIELTIGFLGLIGFGLHIFILILFPALKVSLDPKRDCSKGDILMDCYNVSTEICEMVWPPTEAPCREEVENSGIIVNAGTLIGPKIKRCRHLVYDTRLKGSRMNFESPICKQHFDKIDSIKRNKF